MGIFTFKRNTEGSRLSTVPHHKILIALIFLMPLLAIPFFPLAPGHGKGVVVYLLALLFSLQWFTVRLLSGAIPIPRSLMLYSGALIALAAFVSSILSPNPAASLIGDGFEVGTAFMFLLFILLMFIATVELASVKRIFSLYIMLAYSGIVAFTYVVAHNILHIGDTIPWLPQSLVGDFNDTAVFLGLVAVLSLATLQMVSLSTRLAAIFYISLATSLIGLFFINLNVAWGMLAFISLIIFAYVRAFGGKKQGGAHKRWYPLLPIVIAVFSIGCIVFFDSINKTLYSAGVNTFNVSIRPSWSATFDLYRDYVTHASLRELITGVGPNRFSEVWVRYKPLDVNNTVAWDMDFLSSVGWIPTFVFTTGVIGALLWVAFLGIYVARGTQLLVVLSRESDRVTRYVLASSFLAGVYLWGVTILYAPNALILFLAFLMTGVFIAALSLVGVVRVTHFDLRKNPRAQFIGTSVIIVIIAILLVFGYFFILRMVGMYRFTRGIFDARVRGDIDTAIEEVTSATRAYKSDEYYRELAQLYLAKIQQLVTTPDVSESEIQDAFRLYSLNAVGFAQNTVKIDPTDRHNWMTLAGVYESLIPYRVEGAYEMALKNYRSALERDPRGPTVYLALARLEVTQGNTDKALEYLRNALNLKKDYVAAIFLLASIQAERGDIDEAINSLEIAGVFAPNDIGVFFQLGVMYYTKGDYEKAAAALERAVALNPNYANARYFLGLSLDRLGKRKEAIEQFNKVLELNPDNEELKRILSNLKRGRPALEGVATTVPAR